MTVKTNPVENSSLFGIKCHQKEFPYSAHAGFAYPHADGILGQGKDKQYIVAIILLQTLFALYSYGYQGVPSIYTSKSSEQWKEKSLSWYAQPDCG
ncbi:hypothetical protein OK016_17230 [Vibrio chagasii]|nr:hypothetical protein [Vibrio chagasii]